MVGRRGMRDAGLARHRAQRQPRQPVALQHPLGRLQQGIAQRAMMIASASPGATVGRPRLSSVDAPRRRGRVRGAAGLRAGVDGIFFVIAAL